MAMEKRNLWSASVDANQLDPKIILKLPSMTAIGRKRTLFSAIFERSERPLYPRKRTLGW